jgi:hypothetical protein
MQLRVRAPTATRDWTTFLRQQIEGCFPGTTARVADDDLASALDTAAHARTADGQPAPRVLGWCDLVLQHPAGYPLNDLSELDADPLGLLATRLQRRPYVHYAAYKIILRATDDRWRQSVREQLAHIAARLAPDDLPAHDALLTKAAQPAYDIVVRCIVIAEDRVAAREQLRDMREALAPFDRRTRHRTQRLQVHPLDRLPFIGHPLGRIVAIPPARQYLLHTVGQWLGATALLVMVAAVGALIGVAASRGALFHVLPDLATLSAGFPLHLLLPTAIPRPPVLPPDPAIPLPALAPEARTIVGGLLGALAITLPVLALRPSQRRQRARHAIAAVQAHAHRFVWPGPIWPLPLPGTRRSVLGTVELAALLHVPDASLRQQAIRPIVCSRRSHPRLTIASW